ncbi:MAG: hypothetical protein AAF570_06550 [Bacteroidota bacterium]
MHNIQTAFLILSMLCSVSLAHANTSEPHLKALMENARSENPEISTAAILELRERGPVVIDEFISEHQDAFSAATGAERKSLHHTLDQIAQQKDAFYSRLYWYTDLDKAKAAARAANQPILSLRMLGKLSEDLSCANSRLFRVLLYANSQVRDYLASHYVLHWSSERPVPVVTIDYGDGRVMKRTLTGNSIHYVLDHEGRPIDGIPGLYSPTAFKKHLENGHALFQKTQGLVDDKLYDVLKAHHTQRHRNLTAVATAHSFELPAPPKIEAPTAMAAERITVGKKVAEAPILREMESPRGTRTINPWDEIMGKTEGPSLEERYTAVSATLGITAEVDESSRALMQVKNPGKYASKIALTREARRLEDILMVESAKNEVLIHSMLHRWYMDAGENVRSFDALNTQVYSELFLTPRSDEWLGLLPADVFSAIDDDGIAPAE